MGILLTYLAIMIGGIAVLCELVALIYCAFRRCAFGPALGGAVLIQIGLPVLAFVILTGLQAFAPEPRHYDLIGSFRTGATLLVFLLAGYVTTLAAGWLGCRQIALLRKLNRSLVV